MAMREIPFATSLFATRLSLLGWHFFDETDRGLSFCLPRVIETARR
jgi:hypothetical protein